MSRVTPLSAMLIGLLAAASGAALFADEKSEGPKQWEKAIQKFEEQDRRHPPVKGGILFVGSSSIRFWDLEEHFLDEQPLNRGFGGSQVEDAIYFADRIVLPYEPRIIVMYAGDNDIAAGKSPCEVHSDFEKFVSLVHESLPETRIVYVAIKPSLKRWKLVHRMRAANALILATCVDDERLEFVDIDTPMIGDDDRPRAELFIDDGLHLSPAGYHLWSALVKPHLQ